ncbi:hypothetical protein RGQ29_002132 [Quercus rubra]|uniref:Uncharacterized protein n=1 Tax=Quercus rubra TaxID=3512 RepID=A0AAN7GBG9_QUERU|nr:hypothetical protein RGQ29_002132 [Quercus rubra]
MEDKRTHELPELYAPNGGEGPYSYSQNSNYQRGVVEAAKEKINEAIANHFDIKTFCGSKNPVCMVDLGCSTGANTFITVQNIVEAIKLKYKSKGVNAQIPDFLVFFNDNVSHDFNTLFRSLPPNRQYFAAGVPGSFHDCLFPKESLHLIHSSCALNWLSNYRIKGLVEEAKVDSFNVPAYYIPRKKLMALIERNGNFSIKKMEVLNNQKKHHILQSASLRSLYLRAVLEGIIEKHFGNEILDELFNRFTHKVEGSSFFLNPETDKLIILFVLLERNN